MTPSDIKALMTPDANGLLPCGHCKSDANSYTHTGYMSDEKYVECSMCGAKGPKHSEEKYAFELWNDRAYIPALQELLAVAKAQHEALEKLKFEIKEAEEMPFCESICDEALKLAAPYLEE